MKFSRRVAGGFVAVICSTSCFVNLNAGDTANITCATNADCPKELVCVEGANRCVLRGAACIEDRGDRHVAVANGNQCNDVQMGVCIDGSCRVSTCGDGVVDARNNGELCDQGALNSDTGAGRCRTNCKPARCGDGVTDTLEQCDDGNLSNDDDCLATCEVNVCGDGFWNPLSEACDDGNLILQDACLPGCVANVCGDGIRNPTAECCDDGRTLADGTVVADLNPNDGCDTACACVAWRLPTGSDITDALAFGFGVSQGKATSQIVQFPLSVTADRAGNLYVGEGHRLLRVDLSGIPTVVAGTGRAGFSGDGGPGPYAQIDDAKAIAVDGSGNIFFADWRNHRIRKICGDGVSCTLGHIETVVGSGTPGGAGDGGPAVAAELKFPHALIVDSAGNLYITDASHRVRRVCRDGVSCVRGTIETIAGTGNPAFSGDGSPATAAELNGPKGLALDHRGNLFVADWANRRVRRVCGDPSICTVGDIDTVVGGGVQSVIPAEGLVATDASDIDVVALAIDKAGNLFIRPAGLSKILKLCTDGVGCAVGRIYEVAGTAETIDLVMPSAIGVDADGSLIIVEDLQHRVLRCRNPQFCTDAVTDVVLGTGAHFAPGGGVPAKGAALSWLDAIALDPAGNLIIAGGSAQVFRVCLDSTSCVVGTIETIAGVGIDAAPGDGGPATEAGLRDPKGVAVDLAGNLFISDRSNNVVRMVCGDASSCTVGHIETIAGTGTSGTAGDGVPALTAELKGPAALAIDALGNLFIADGSAYRVMRVCRDATKCTVGNMDLIAGVGFMSFFGDGGPADQAGISHPGQLTVDADGNLFIASEYRVRRVCGDPSACTVGNIDTVAGGGADTGDGGPALDAYLENSYGVAVDAGGNLFISERLAHRVRKVCVDGIGCTIGNIETIAGIAGEKGFSGDWGPAVNAHLNFPGHLLFDASNNLLIADERNGAVRKICFDGVACTVGHIETVAGAVLPPGDGPFVGASLSTPRAMAWDGTLGILFADGSSGRIRRADLGTKELKTVVGYPTGLWDDATPPLRADRSRLLYDPLGIAYYDDGATRTFFVTERDGQTIRRITFVDPTDPATWTIDTWAGALPRSACCTDPDACTASELADPNCVDDSPGTCAVVGAPPVSLAAARFAHPAGLSIDRTAGYLYLADAGNHVIRRIDIAAGEVITIAGMPRQIGYWADGSDGDGDGRLDGVAAAEALFSNPSAVAVGPGFDAAGNLAANRSLYIADTGNNRIRRLALGPNLEPLNVTTVVGDGQSSSSGVGAPARIFGADSPVGVVVDAYGNVFFSSRTAIRAVYAGPDGVATATDVVDTIYGSAPRDAFPQSVTMCLSGLMMDPTSQDDDGLYFLDSCQGFLIRLQREVVGP